MGKLIAFEEKLVREIDRNYSNNILGLKFWGFLITIFNIALAFIFPYILLKTIKKIQSSIFHHKYIPYIYLYSS